MNRTDGGDADEVPTSAVESPDRMEPGGVSDDVAADAALCPPSQSGRSAPDERQLGDWIARVVDRDANALAALYDALVGRVYGLALRITQRAPLAEEVAQDTFWQIWRQAPRFDPERGTALAWIMTIARSRALDALRRIETNECELDPEILDRLECPGEDAPPDLLAAVQDGHVLHAALASLDPVPRQLVSLAFFRGLSHDEIAGYAGLPLGTVKSHIRRALIALRQRLAPDANSRL
ncbi:sigma-70 family RNA polymerase sigma factor [Methylococcus geothermalis]|nr:sigma-70 family RNA polymerase sigma factor [Methylococcus geothermalis]